MFMSVATNALSNYAFAAQAPQNSGKLRVIVIFAFAASAGWFFLSEYVGSLKEIIQYYSQGYPGEKGEAYEKAVDSVGKSGASLKLSLLLILSSAASVISLSWPFVESMMETVHEIVDAAIRMWQNILWYL
jgi:hypothetical protein